MCKILGCSRSGYHRWVNNPRQHLSNYERQLLFLIATAFEENARTYGYRKIYKHLTGSGVKCYKNQIEKLMKIAGISPIRKKKYRVTTNSKHNLPISPNLLKRNFRIEDLNKVWVGDITYIWTKEGWLYLSTVIDLFSRRVVGYSTGKRLTKSLVIESMENAIRWRKPPEGLIFHSDRGSQYASNDFRKLLTKHEMKQSMSRKGDCWDNAVAESFFKTIKCELTYCQDFRSRIEAELNIFEYIEMFYNTRRLHS